MAKYRVLERGVYNTENGRAVPPDPSNPDWQEYISWFAGGGIPDPFTPEAVPPENLRQYYIDQGAARTSRQMQRLSNDELIDLLRKKGTV